MKNIDSRIATMVSRRKPLRMIGIELMVGTIAASACGGSSSDSNAPAAATAAPVAETVNIDMIDMIGKIDADKGPAGSPYNAVQGGRWPSRAWP